MNKYILITTTFNNKKNLKNVTDILLERRLISCIQISKIKSKYFWENKLVTSKEYLVKMKTRKDLYKKIENIILENHNYKVPEIICYDINDGNLKYLLKLLKKFKKR